MVSCFPPEQLSDTEPTRMEGFRVWQQGHITNPQLYFPPETLVVGLQKFPSEQEFFGHVVEINNSVDRV